MGRGRYRSGSGNAGPADLDADPDVLGFRLTGTLVEGATATDLVLTITERLRKHGVVGKFVEFFGAGLENLTIADRATLGNMCPEYGATIAIFPIDAMTLDYLRLSGRDAALVSLVEAYARAQGLFRQPGDPDPVYSETIELDSGTVEPSLAGPRRPQDRVSLKDAKNGFLSALGGLQAAIKKPAETPSTIRAKAANDRRGRRCRRRAAASRRRAASGRRRRRW
jgi:aconitate hydratase